MNKTAQLDHNSTKVLSRAVKFWFVIVLIGQVIFALYVFGLYGLSTINGEFEKWNTTAPHGYEADDLIGTIIFGVHVMLAGIITIGGPLQLMPQVRNRWPRLHRVNGRLYILAAFVISFAGLYLSWVKGSVGGLVGSIFITINAILILISAYYTITHAMRRTLDQHRRWAIRLFLCMSGVWLFRVLLMLWFAIFQGPYGFDPEAFEGPALNFLYICSYILPIIVVQWYFFAQESGRSQQLLFASFLTVVTLGIAVGSIMATIGMWLPSFN